MKDEVSGFGAESMMVRVTTLGPLRRIVSIEDEELVLHDGATVAEAIDLLVARHPELLPHRGSMLAAVDEEWVEETTALRDGSSLVLMPPVSGG